MAQKGVFIYKILQLDAISHGYQPEFPVGSH